MSSFDDPVIISCSISGVIANRDQCPAIPYTPEEYAAEARRAVDEGASQIHIHARKPDGTPSIQPKQSASSTDSDQLMLALPEPFLKKTTSSSVSVSWCSSSQARNAWGWRRTWLPRRQYG